ncbi:MAG: hypothetical protein ABR985_15450, partial [Methanotrichaceae archaeon]
MKDKMNDEEAFRKKVEESIEPAIKAVETAHTAYVSVLDNITPNLKQLEEKRTAYMSAVASAVESTTTTLKHMETTASADKIGIQKSIEPMMKNLRDAVQSIKEKEK